MDEQSKFKEALASVTIRAEENGENYLQRKQRSF